MKPMTDKEFKLFTFLSDSRNWRAPTFRKMSEHLSHASDGYISYALKSLIKKGYIGADYKPRPYHEDNAT